MSSLPKLSTVMVSHRAHDRLHIVLDEEYGDTAALHLTHHFHHLTSFLGIHPGKGLIHEQ